MDYSSATDILQLLKDCQNAELDNREKVRDAHYFVEKTDGQWEPDVITRFSSRPKYTFDHCTPIVDQIYGEINQSSFDVKIRPSGGPSTDEIAGIYDGLIRNIENISNARETYDSSARDMVIGGLSGWEVVQDYNNEDSFDQDLMIKPISDFVNRVWFDQGAERQDMSDANYAFVLHNLTKAEYDAQYPEGSNVSVGDSKQTFVYNYKPEFVTVGKFYWKEPVQKTLVQMSDGKIYEADENFQSVVDELALQNITVQAQRTVESFEVKCRYFDGADWLTEVQDTVFRDIPVIPTFGNFRISDGKIVYHGIVQKMMDAQRVLNYAKSREVEEVALAPRAKYWMTPEQASGHEKQLQTLNTNSDPVQFYQPDDRVQNPPPQIGGAQVNQGLSMVAQTMIAQIQQTAGMYGVNQGDIQNKVLSGTAIQSLQNKGDNGTLKFFNSQKIAIKQTAKILVNAIPKVYDSTRSVRILNQDGTQEHVKLNEVMFDQQTGEFVELNDLSQGAYDVALDVGPAFQNRQQETVRALQELIAVVPEVGQISADILTKNIPTPSMDVVSDRLRAQMLRAGLIPQDQLTQEEQAQIQQAQALASQQPPPPPEPADLIAQAQVADTQSKTRERDAKLQLAQQQQILDAQEATAKHDLEQLKLQLQAQDQAAENQQALIEAQMKGQSSLYDIVKEQAETLKTLREAMGVDAIVSPQGMQLYKEQSDIVSGLQDEVEK